MSKGLRAMLKLELVSAEFHEVLHRLNTAGIEITDLQQLDELTGSFWIRYKDYACAAHICENLGEKIRTVDKRGIILSRKDLAARWLLICGVSFLIFAYLFIPTRILFVQVEGNRTVPSRQILAAAETCGIHFGALRRSIRSEKVKNALLSAVPELQWAGVNTTGCTATVTVRERTVQKKESSEENAGSIVASRDGFILSATATRGNLAVQPGQTVTQGQLLISGYTGDGRVIRSEAAQGEIIAQTNRQLRVIYPLSQEHQAEAASQKKKISLRIGKKRINLWKDSGISGGSCGRMYEEYYITLPGGFRLPAALCVERFSQYSKHTQPHKADFAETDLAEYAQRYLAAQMTAGQIIHSNERWIESNGCVILEGDYLCREMIGHLQPEQIGDINGKNNGTGG